MRPSIHVKEEENTSDEECDDLKDSQINEYKEAVYKFFQFRTYKLRSSNGDFGCPFCDDYKEEHQYQYFHLLLHAIRVCEGFKNGKQRANHFAMARYLVIDLANEVQAEVDRLSKGETDAIDKALRLERELNDKEKTLKNLLKENEYLKRSNRNLLAELKGVKKELLKGLNDWRRGKKSGIGIKQMGEIDVNVFKKAFSKKGSRPSDVETRAEALCSLWQEKLKNSEWQPFQMVGDDKGNLKRVVSGEDEALRLLKRQWGDELYSEVLTALKDLYEYNPSRCHTVAEIWNFGENRKAKLEEVISYVFRNMGYKVHRCNKKKAGESDAPSKRPRMTSEDPESSSRKSKGKT